MKCDKTVETKGNRYCTRLATRTSFSCKIAPEDELLVSGMPNITKIHKVY